MNPNDPRNIDSFIPTTDKINSQYGFMVVQLFQCFLCKKKMIQPPPNKNYGHSTFPYYYLLSFSTQIERAGWVPMSCEKVDDHNVCIECVKSGKLTITCALCHWSRPSSEYQERFGDPPEYLCKICYMTISAKSWDEICQELREKHKYDFE